MVGSVRNKNCFILTLWDTGVVMSHGLKQKVCGLDFVGPHSKSMRFLQNLSRIGQSSHNNSFDPLGIARLLLYLLYR